MIDDLGDLGLSSCFVEELVVVGLFVEEKHHLNYFEYNDDSLLGDSHGKAKN
jgi:hypothetical protein